MHELVKHICRTELPYDVSTTVMPLKTANDGV